MRHQRPQAGFTLLELTLVLAMLVIMAAIVWPALDKPLSVDRLRRGADTVRAEWTRTRIRAMTTGIPHVFRYQPLTNVYQVEVWGSDESQLESGSVSDFGIPQPGVVSQAAGDRGLPDGIVFDANVTMQTVRGAFVGADGAGGAGWSDPIYFFPDGTTSQARLLLHNELGLYIVLDLRGLTGVTTVSDVLTQDELR